jgi:iron-sulfur cluster assembly protein
MTVTLTKKAIKQFKDIFIKNNDPQACLQVGVRDGGCSGMSYTMDLVKQVDGEHSREDLGDFQMIVLKEHEPYLNGLVVDYNDSILNSGFKFSNPKAMETCGCGSSFSIEARPESGS